MKRSYLIGTDIGTSSSKTVVTDSDGVVLAAAAEAYGVLCPREVWAEQWPEVWEAAAKNTIRRAVRESGVDTARIGGMCISGLYGGSGVPLDSDLAPVRPCIIWMDRRTEEICARLRRELDAERLFSITENGVDSYFGYTKILWIRENEPENWARIKLFLTPNQFVIQRLTGQICIDRTSAGNLGGLFDCEGNTWSEEMLGRLGIPRAMLPERILAPTEVAGTLTPQAAKDLGLPAGLPVSAGCVDCLASTLATGAIAGGQSVAVLATSLNWGLLQERKPANPKYISMPYVTPGTAMRYTYGGISTAGALSKWFAESFAPGALGVGGEERLPFGVLEQAAREIAPGCEGLLALPYFMGERTPIWDARARGALVGLTLKHGAVHIYRAILESIGFALRHVIEDHGGGGRGVPCTLVGGGSASELWVRILADVTGESMACLQGGVEAPVGDAFLAGIGCGAIAGFERLRDWPRHIRTVHPDWRNHEVYSRYFQIYRRLYLSLREDLHALADLAEPTLRP